MKNFISILVSIFFATSLVAQDYIILKNGEDIESKVLEVNNDNIKYKRYSNTEGPTYTMQKSKIFMIKYASGDKDVFNNANEIANQKTTNTEQARDTNSSKEIIQKDIPKHNNKEFEFDHSIGSEGCKPPIPFRARIHGSNSSKVFITQEIIYFGMDFTYSKLTNHKKTGKGTIFIEKHIPQIHKIIEKDFLSIFNLRRWLKKTKMYFGTDITLNYQHIDAENYIITDNYCLNIEDVEKIVKGYNLKEKEGIGMVINIGNLNKHKEMVSLFVTFFDISTRKILYSVEATGRSRGSGWAKHYAIGIKDAVRSMFIDRIYKKRLTDNSQIPQKLLLR